MPQRFDLHTHFFTNWDKGKFSLERHERSPKFILKAMQIRGLDGIVLVNAGVEKGWRDAYEQVAEQVNDKKRLGKYSLIKKIGSALEFTDNERLYKIIKGQEILTKQGHIVAIGLDYGKIIPSGLELETSLKEIRNLGAVADAPHVFGFTGIGKENLSRYRDYFDIFEGKNMNYEHILLKSKIGINPSKDELKEISEDLKLNWIAVSDCHNWKDLGNGYIEIENLDFSSADNLRASLRYFLVSGKFTPIAKKANPLTSVLGHMVVWMYDNKIRKKYGWVNLEDQKI